MVLYCNFIYYDNHDTYDIIICMLRNKTCGHSEERSWVGFKF